MAAGKRYPIVKIDFLDHSECSGENVGVVPVQVIGYLIYEDRIHYQVASWVADSGIDHPDTVVFTVVKHKGVKVKKIA